MSLELYIRPDEYIGLNRADIYPNEGIQINRAILSQTGINNTSKQFTRDFNLPATPRNNQLLYHWEKKDNESIVNPNKSIPARITIDDIYSISGSLELLSVTWKQKKPESYKVVFYGDSSNIKALLGSTMLDDIDWSPLMIDPTTDLPFIWSVDSVTRSWDRTVDATKYFIPVMGWKRNFKWYETGTGEDDIAASTDTGVLLSELRVGLSLLDMIKQIGLYVDTNFVIDAKTDTYMKEAFIFPSKYEDQALTLSEALYETRVEASTAINVSTRTVLNMDVVLSDPRGRWDGTNTYTPEFNGQYHFELPFTKVTGSGNISYDFYLHENGTEVQADAISTGSGGTINLYYNCTAGALYTFEAESSKNSTINVGMFTASVPISIIGLPYDPSENMPVMQAVDFMSAFLKAFNLLMYQTDLNEYTIIDTTSLYVNNQQPIDMQSYIDNALLTYEKVKVFDQINFHHKVNEVIGNIFYYDTSGKYYGQLFFEPDVDFSDGELEQESAFSITPPTYVDVHDSSGAKGRTDLWCHFQLTNDTPPKPKLANFLLCYRNTVEDTAYTWYLQDAVDPSGDPTFASQIQWGRYSQVQDTISTVDSNTLCYSFENPYIGVPAENTIVGVFWYDWLLQLYKRTAYTLDVTFPINFGIYLKITSLSLIYMNGFYHFLAGWQYNSATSMITLKLFRFDTKTGITSTRSDHAIKIEA